MEKGECRSEGGPWASQDCVLSPRSPASSGFSTSLSHVPLLEAAFIKTS